GHSDEDVGARVSRGPRGDARNRAGQPERVDAARVAPGAALRQRRRPRAPRLEAARARGARAVRDPIGESSPRDPVPAIPLKAATAWARVAGDLVGTFPLSSTTYASGGSP